MWQRRERIRKWIVQVCSKNVVTGHPAHCGGEQKRYCLCPIERSHWKECNAFKQSKADCEDREGSQSVVCSSELRVLSVTLLKRSRCLSKSECACVCCFSSRSRRKMQNVSNLSIMTMLIMYMLSALFGYLTFYGKTDDTQKQQESTPVTEHK